MLVSKLHSSIRQSIVLVSLFAALTSAACKKKEVPVPVPETTSATVANYAVGDKVDVKWNSSWWKGEVLSVEDGKYRVHYTGWSSSWDESVAADRLRPLSSESKVGASVEGTGTPDPNAVAAAASAVATAVTPPPVAATTGAFKVGDKKPLILL